MAAPSFGARTSRPRLAIVVADGTSALRVRV